jgi:hypothetical protein
MACPEFYHPKIGGFLKPLAEYQKIAYIYGLEMPTTGREIRPGISERSSTKWQKD